MSSRRHSRAGLRNLSMVFLLALALAPGRPLQASAALPQPRPGPGGRGPARPAVNHVPVANNDHLAAFTNAGFQMLYVLDNDTDADGDALTITHVGFAAHGQAVNEFDGNGLNGIDYRPNDNFSGIDSFAYTITDGLAVANATVTVAVSAQGTAAGHFAIYAGPGDSSRWTASSTGGTTGTSAANGTCDSSAGLSIEDVALQSGRFDAFDHGLTFWIDNQEVTPSATMFVTHHSLVSGPVFMSNLGVVVYYDGLPGSDTLRTRVVLANTSGSTQVVTATLATNVGSNANTVVIGTSSGDPTFSTADRWLVTSDSASNPGLIVNTHVLYGPGSPPETPSFVSQSVFDCPGLAPQGVRARFNLSIPSGGVKQLLFFNQAHTSNQAALAGATAFDGSPIAFLDGLSNIDLAQIVNWKIGPIARLYLPLVER